MQRRCSQRIPGIDVRARRHQPLYRSLLSALDRSVEGGGSLVVRPMDIRARRQQLCQNFRWSHVQRRLAAAAAAVDIGAAGDQGRYQCPVPTTGGEKQR